MRREITAAVNVAETDKAERTVIELENISRVAEF
jgi:hypothetical protein